jgi:hypothetical protein
MVADVMVPEASLATFTAMLAVPLAFESALVMAGTSLAADTGTVNVVVVLVSADGPVVGESEHPTARAQRAAMTNTKRFILFCLP